MKNALSSVFESLMSFFSNFWGLFVDIHKIGFYLILSAKYYDDPSLGIYSICAGISTLLCITFVYVMIGYIIFSKIKSNKPKIERIESTGIIINKQFQPGQKYYNDTRKLNVIPPQYIVTITSNRLEKNFNNKKLYFSNEKIVPVILVKKIDNGKIEMDLELPEK